MVEQIQRRFGKAPRRWLADSGYNGTQDVEYLASVGQTGIEAFIPLPAGRGGGIARSPRPYVGPAILAWRERMQSERGKATIAEVRDSPSPGGMAHACELETSIYLALEPNLVQMDKAVREIPEWDSEHVWLDWSDGPLSVWPHWSGLSRSGVVGDATVATREKGEVLLSAAVTEISEFIAEMSRRRRLPGEDHHEG